jgi:uncharacterized protein
MSFEMLDGFLHAVVIGPEPILPSEWLRHLWSADGSTQHTWKDEDEAHQITALLMRHVNSIAAPLRMDEGDWTPMLDAFVESGRRVTHGQEWSMGFLRGMDLRRPLWQPLLDDPAFADGLDALQVLALGRDNQDPGRKVRTQYQRDKLIDRMLTFVDVAAGYWLEREPRPDPVRRKAPKVGRNEPCPCGSGKKFKQCCGGGGGTAP